MTQEQDIAIRAMAEFSPELLAIIKNVKPASDEEIAELADIAVCYGWATELRLIARIVKLEAECADLHKICNEWSIRALSAEDTLMWVRKNYAGGSTKEINERIEKALAKAGQP